LALLISVCRSGAASVADGEPFVPANPPAMLPIGRPDVGPGALPPGSARHLAALLLSRPSVTPAFQAAGLFRRGVNLGDYLEANRYAHSLVVSADEFVQMRREGFDHVRVPIGWHQYAGPAPAFALEPEIFARVDFVVTNALQNHLAVMINLHHFDALDHDPAAAAPEFLALWRQIAAHYQQAPRQLAFELDNEPHDNATTALMNPLYAQAIALIRQTNPHRTLFVEPGGWGSINEMKNLVLPPDDNVIVSAHCYEPFFFTHQGAGWTGGLTPVTGIVFPGPPAQPLVPDPELRLQKYQLDWFHRYNTLPAAENPSSSQAFTGQLQYLCDWSHYYGRPVHLGEFGAYTKADPASRVRFYAALRSAAECRNIGWCIWDWSAGFRYWDRAHHEPVPGMHAALFGQVN
jgi:endoglucanase